MTYQSTHRVRPNSNGRQQKMVGKFRLLAAVSACLTLLAGCSMMPASGPTSNEIDDNLAQNNPLGLKMVAVTKPVVDVLAAEPAADMIETPQPVPTDRIGAGDLLTIQIFETGSGLFSEPPSSAGTSSIAASSYTIPPTQVDTLGQITIPYLGRVKASGLTPYELAQHIEAGLKTKSLEPQVLVSVNGNIANTVILSGEIHGPGRYPLTPAHERLLDVLALAGGPNHPALDTVVEFTRGTSRHLWTLSDITTLSPRNLVLAPGDRIRLDFQPRSFTVFGAADRITELPFTTNTVSLAQAMARAAGPRDDQADPQAVYLFRFERPEPAERLGLTVAGNSAPVIYKLDLLDPTSYFLMQEISLRDQDMIYVANSRVNRLRKFLGLIAELFAPAASSRTIAQ